MNNKYLLIMVTIFTVIILLSGSFTSAAFQQKTPVSDSFNFEENNYQNTPSFIKSSDKPYIVKILYPLSSIPVLVEKGGNFTIDFQIENFDSLSAYISTAYEPIVDEFELELGNSWKTDSTWHVIAFVPQNTPDELYNLTLIIQKNDEFISCSQPRAVSVIDEFSDNFSFIHVTDFHIGDPRGLRENIWETIGWKAAKKCIEEVNLLSPDFVVITGDLVFGQLYPFEYTWEYKKCYEILQMFQVPTFLVPGNHDGYVQTGQDGFKFWQEYFGPLYYSFNYGDYHFTSVNSYDWPKLARFGISYLVFNWGGYIQNKQLDWIEEDLENSNAKLNFMLLHHNPIWDTKNDSLLKNGYGGRAELLTLIDEYDIDAVLAGHVHYDDITSQNDTLFITTTTMSSSLSRSKDTYWGYRLIDIQNGEIKSYNYKEPKFSIPSYKLNCKFTDSHTAIVENDLEMDVKAHLTFLLPLGNYNIENGEILMQREKNDMVEIYVESEVEKESDVTISLSLQ